MNICDDDDDDGIMEFLIHDEDDDFTEALIIVSNILEEESDDDEPLVPHMLGEVVHALEELPTSNVFVFFTRTSFVVIFGVQLPSTTQHTSRSLSRFPSDSLMILCRR
jgi:hypothetical protein